MNPTKGYYSLIQYCPDFSRAERANIGVLLFCPEKRFIDARTSAGNDRISKFFGRDTFDPRRVNEAKRAIEDRLKSREHSIASVEALQEFIRRRANEIVISDLRPMKVRNPAEDLDQLFQELVGGRRRREKKKEVLFPELDEAFRGPRFQGRIAMNQVVEIPTLGTLQADYSYRNGIINLVKAKEFPKTEDAVSREVSNLVLFGHMLSKKKASDEQERKLIVIPSLPDDFEEVRLDGIEKLFREYQTRLIRPSGLDDFIDEVDQVSHA